MCLGGDGGGGSFKDGIVVLNQDMPQSPLNVRWLGSVSGAKDTRDVLEKTARVHGSRWTRCSSIGSGSYLDRDVAFAVARATTGPIW